MFGFKLEVCQVSEFGTCTVRYMLRSGRSTVAYDDKCQTWRGCRELPLVLDLAPAEDAPEYREMNMEKFMQIISGKELVIRSSDKDRKTPYGFTKVRLIRHIILPEFGSVEELKLKLAARG